MAVTCRQKTKSALNLGRGLVAIACVAVAGCERNDNANRPARIAESNRTVASGKLVITSQSENQKRTQILPAEPSEDATHILGRVALPDERKPEVEREYLPELAVNWVVDVSFEGDSQLDPQVVDGVFDKEWRESFGGFTSYGRASETGRWTFLVSADGPQSVDKLKFAFDYADPLHDDAPLPTETLYQQRLEKIAERLRKFGALTVTSSLTPRDASHRSTLLHTIKQELDISAVLILKAPPGGKFDGKAIWDVMLCLGLKWGDMDCFHWRNPSDVGDDYLFSVETTTPPGYFLPEEIAADRVHVSDLVFVFSVPRCANPVDVFDAMNRAVEYCKSRLGGSVSDANGNLSAVAEQRERIAEVVGKLRSAGFEPGAGATLQLF